VVERPTVPRKMSGQRERTGNREEPFAPVWPDRSGLIVPGDAKSLTATDLNGDVWPDFVVGVNDDCVVAFEHAGSPTNRVIGVRLEGRSANPTAVGSRVTVYLDDDKTQTAEIHAGGGYLSQSSATLVFGLGSGPQVDKVEVRWPDGVVTETSSPAGPHVVIRRSD